MRAVFKEIREKKKTCECVYARCIQRNPKKENKLVNVFMRAVYNEIPEKKENL